MSTDPRPLDERDPATPASKGLGFILDLAVLVLFVGSLVALAVVLT
ncbi:hypothetical protein [Occultella gossypii]|uniref:RDD family protein n=1 Tax=Occultella gossypii TaxID=2800820 RepID=A0ABS7SDB0_9MICO|nr:hypothetical protein [Occultella gossypii]MBZ2197246.1 hypothetical protein [Occultella gossypii]